jgi:threonyl-tRNA synthetase
MIEIGTKQRTLENVLKHKKTEYQINKGDGAFYGPKIDFTLKNLLQNLAMFTFS